MPNNFITMQNIARTVLPLLTENLVMPMTVNRNYSADFIGKGDTIVVEKPAVFVADEFGGTINLQDIGERSVSVKMDKLADVSFKISAKDLALSMPQFKTKYLESAAQAIAEKINADGLALYKDVPFYSGTAGVTPDALEDFANAEKVLNDNKAPMMNRTAVWDTAAKAKFQVLDAIVNAEKSGSTAALRAGAIGRVAGFENLMSQAVKTHVAGAYTSNSDVTVTTGSAGDTSIVMTSAGGTSTDKLVKGDIFTIDGKQYVATADTANAVAGVVTVTIYPALDKDIADMDSTAVEFADLTAGGHVANLAYNKDAFIFVTRPLDTPPGVESYVTSYNGITLRVTMDYNITTKETTMSIDTLYDYVTAYPELAVRNLG